MRNKYLQRLKVTSYKILINYKEENSNFMLKKPGKYHLTQMISVNITSGMAY